MHQLALALGAERPGFDEPYLYHDIRRAGFVALVTPGGPRRQVAFKLHELPARIAAVRAQGLDSYLSQNEFYKPDRRVVHCWRLTSCYVDLDSYRVPRLASLPPEAATDELLLRCDAEGIPPPTVVIASGRGLQAKWVFPRPIPSRALPRWQLVQSELCARLVDLGADPRALDASRVLRLVGTVNTKSSALVRIIHATRTPAMGGMLSESGFVVHDFETLADTLLPISRSELERRRTERQALEQDEPRPQAERRRRAVRESLVVIPGGQDAPSRHPGAQRLVPSELSWDRLHDLRRLVELRGWGGGVPVGHRDTFVFLAASFLATARVATAFRAEVHALAREFAPDWTDAEVRSCVSAVLSRAEAAARGEKVNFGGHEVDPRYRFKNDRLVEMLQVTPDEMTQLTTIIDRPEARRRDAQRKAAQRLERGCQTRADYLANAREKAARAQALRAMGLSLSAIARELGISRSAASAYCRGC